ncbi:MAG: hypothetical protein M0Z67_03515 [Nitrospiraceae bacterium]|nr:hypothetical protein [Nitrospiraceae bacterium]
MVSRVDTLCDADKEMMLDFSRLCITRLGDHLPLKLFISVLRHFLDANVLKEIDKDRLIIEHAAAAFYGGKGRAVIDVNGLFEMTKQVDHEFINRFSNTFLSIRVRYDDFAEIRKERIFSFIGLVFDLLGNWQDGLSFAEVVKRTFSEERYAQILCEILHLYNLETKMLSNSITFHGPAAKLKDLFAEKLLAAMESTAGEIAVEHARRAYDCAVENLRKAPRKPVVHTTITRQNFHAVEEFLDALSGLPIKGVGFSFYTPHRTEDNGLFIPVDERDPILDELLRLRKKYWRILGLTATMANQFRKDGEFSEWNSIDKCPVNKVCNCYNADGTLKPCTYGSDADCSRCCCASIPLYRAAIRHLDPLALFMIYRMVK